MTTINYILTDGSTRSIDASADTSVMENAIWNDVPGILAICGGSMSCGTCHVYISPADAALFAPVSEDEEDLLEFAAAERRPTSRLSCQLVLGDAISQVTVQIPERQE